MEPNNFILKAHLGSNLDYFLEKLRYISSVVNQLNPKTNDCDFWCISDGGAVTFISDKDYPNIELMYPIGNASWEQVSKIMPKINEFFDRFNLIRYIGKIHSEVWPIHRHVFDHDSQWSLSVFDTGVENSKLHFYKATDMIDEVYDVKSFYDKSKPDYTELINPKDIYTIKTDEWHSYEVESSVEVYLLYPKNLTSSDSATNYISTLSQL